MTKKARQPYQYEPPVTPAGWKGDEQRFSIRVKAILEDLYQKFSSLSSRPSGGGSVESVNGVLPDASGNVEIPVDGEDGFSPTVTATETSDGILLTITDVNGTKSASVKNGAIGPQGPQGETGPQGPKGDSASLLNVYPVGSIYLSVNSTSPASLFGGTWTQLQNRFLLGAGSNYANGATGGAATHTLTIDEIPSHDHAYVSSAAFGTVPSGSAIAPIWGDQYGGTGIRTGLTGGGAAHNNMPPYLAVYMWKRVS